MDAAHALRQLPGIRPALGSGELSIDKAVELSRFASPEDEAALLRWAEGVSAGAIRRRADREARRDREEVRRAEAARALSWWYPEPDRFEMQVQTSAADGAQLVAAITERARTLPVLPGEEDGYFQAARYADALVSFCLEAPGGGEAPVPTVVLHATLEALASDDGSCPLEDGGIVHAEAARRLACTAKLQVVLEDGTGTPLAQGGTRRDPSPAMMRALRYRDGECRFSGCGARRFLQAHHIRWRSRAGITVPRNLILLCFFHHKLVHEYGWSLTREPDGIVSWFRPDGTRYRAGPAPP